MKKFLLMFSTVLMLMVCLCIPSFATDYCDDWNHYFGGSSTCEYCGLTCAHDFESYPDYHICSNCGFSEYCSYMDSVCKFCGGLCPHNFERYDGVCDFCGWPCPHDQYVNGRCAVCEIPDFSVYACDHVGLNNVVLFVGPDYLHYFGCPDCSWSGLFTDVLSFMHDTSPEWFPPEYFEPHQYDGECFCSDFGDITPMTQFFGLYCSHVVEDGFPIYACTDGHYISCKECGYYRPVEDLVVSLGSVSPGFDTGHVPGEVDGVCMMLSGFASDLGIEENLVETNVSSSEYFPSASSSSSILPDVTSVVTAAVGWITAFVLCIMSNSLLLIFIVSIFAILGLYLLKRSIHL